MYIFLFGLPVQKASTHICGHDKALLIRVVFEPPVRSKDEEMRVHQKAVMCCLDSESVTIQREAPEYFPSSRSAMRGYVTTAGFGRDFVAAVLCWLRFADGECHVSSHILSLERATTVELCYCKQPDSRLLHRGNKSGCCSLLRGNKS